MVLCRKGRVPGEMFGKVVKIRTSLEQESQHLFCSHDELQKLSLMWTLGSCVGCTRLYTVFLAHLAAALDPEQSEGGDI